VIRNAAAAIAPLDLVRHVRSATAWGRATAQAAEIDTPVSADAAEGPSVRGIGLDAEALRELPSTAALVLTPDGPVVTDTNPGILTLSTATLATVEDSRSTGTGGDAGHGGATGPAAEAPTRRGSSEPGSETGRPRIIAPDGRPPADTPGGSVGAGGRSAPKPVGAAGRIDPEQVPPNLGPPPERLDWRV
jgi:hypothetical protein